MWSMIRCSLVLLIIHCTERFVMAFSWTHPSTHNSLRQISSPHHFHLQSTTSSSETTEQVKAKVARISVCMGELCQCQGEEFEYSGGAADAALEKLQCLNLPFPIDDVGCMGACGMGTMIAIDYENGDSIMTDGLKGVMSELGLKVGSSDGIAQPISESLPNEDVSESDMLESSYRQATVESQKLIDVRERMREDAKNDEEQGNPWVNMASYLAKKAMDNVLGRE